MRYSVTTIRLTSLGMRSRKRCASALSVLSVGVMLALLPAPADAKAGSSRSNVTVVLNTFSAPDVFSLVFIGEAYGYFEKHGINLKLVADSSNPIAPLLSGSAQISFPSVDFIATSETTAHGVKPDVQAFYGLNKQGPLDGYVVVNKAASSSITSMAGLAGKTVGTLVPGTGLWFKARYYQKVFHVKYNIVPIGDGPTLISAVESGRVDAALLTGAQADQAVADGCVLLLNAASPAVEKKVFPNVTGKIFDSTPYVVATASRRWLQKNPAVAQAFVAAMNDAKTKLAKGNIGAIARRVAQRLAGAGGQLNGFTAAALTIDFRRARQAQLPAGVISQAGWNSELRFLVTAGALKRVAQLPFKKFVNTTWIPK